MPSPDQDEVAGSGTPRKGAAQRPRSAADRRGSSEREFLPAALEIVETPANPIGRAIALSVAAFFLIALAWAVTGETDIVAVAQGRVVPTGGIKVVQPLETGIVRKIHVRDGQHIKSGDLLIELDPTDSEVDKDQLLRERMEAVVEVARLRAIVQSLSGQEPVFTSAQDVDPDLVELYRGRLTADLDAIAAEKAAMKAELTRRAAERAASKAEIAKLQEMLPLFFEHETALRKLYEKGVVTKPNWLQAKTQMIETRQNIAVEQSRLKEAAAAMEVIRKEAKQRSADVLRQTYAELLEAEKSFAQLDLALLKALYRERQSKLTAPVDGTVQQLAVHTEGGVVTPAQALLVIVPDDAPLEIRAQVLNRDKGFVKTGQHVEVKLDAFPFTKYGTIDGRVVDLSGDAIEHEQMGLVYDAKISLKETVVRASGREVPLVPGMAVSVEIKTGRRKIVEFLLSPLQRYQDEALRER